MGQGFALGDPSGGGISGSGGSGRADISNNCPVRRESENHKVGEKVW